MRVASEHYKGIEFVRISALPKSQIEILWQSFDTNKIIKILHHDALLNDCIQYNDYAEWFSKSFTTETLASTDTVVAPSPVLQVA